MRLFFLKKPPEEFVKLLFKSECTQLSCTAKHKKKEKKNLGTPKKEKKSVAAIF